MDQMIRKKERVERAVAHLIKTQIMLLLRIGMLGEAIDLRQRRTDHIIHNPTESAKLFNVIELSDFHHVVSVLGARDMPRDFTTMPVAFATIACSKLNFDPSA